MPNASVVSPESEEESVVRPSRGSEKTKDVSFQELICSINFVSESDNGFTITGRIFDMSTPDKVTTTGQALLDHYMGRMTESEDGANCSTIDACQSVEYYVAVVGGGQLQSLTGGIYSR